MSSSQFVFDAIGTKWVIDHLPRLDPRVAAFLEKHILELVEGFDQKYSRFRADSDVTIWSKKAGEYTLDQDAKEMFDLYRTMYDLTDGAMTPLIGSVISDAGYDASYSFEEKELQKPYGWDEAIDYGFPLLTLKKPELLDFGALGKGHLIDLVANYLEEQGIHSYCIDAGGDLLYKNPSFPLSIGLEHPEDLSQVIGVVQLKDQSICASAGNRRKWGKFHHIFDPRTLSSASHILASWVIADRAITADALATALFLVEPDRLKENFSFSYLLLYPDFSIKKSTDFPGELYYTT